MPAVKRSRATKRPQKTEHDLRELWRAGNPIDVALAATINGLNHEDLKREEVKSISRAFHRGRGFKKHSNGNYSRLCDECNKPRGSMWVVDTDVWKIAMPEERWGDDICQDCWYKISKIRKAKSRS